MVGIPKSTGCANCRRRKKKCGEERPECRACVSAGWTCPGYARRWKFVDGNAQTSALYRVTSNGIEKPDYDSDLKRKSQHTTNDLVLCRRAKIASSGPFDLWPNQSRPLMSEADKAASRLISMLNDPSAHKLCQIRSHANFIDYVPSRLGRNAALDSAVSSLCSLFADALIGNRTVESLRLYGNAVTSLQVCVKSPKLRMESETLCSSILLQICELLKSPGNDKWVHLFKGSKVLFESVGPERCTSEFDRAMLESQRVWFMLQDLGKRQSCFLAQPEWKRVFSPPVVTPVTLRNPKLSLRSSFCDMLVDIPDLLSDVSRVLGAENDETSEDIQTRRSNILSRVVSQKRWIETWYTTDLEPLFLSGGDSRYPNVLVAIMDFISSSTLLNLCEALSTLSSILPQHLVDPAAVVDQVAIANWKDSVRESFAFAGGTSWVISEPLKCLFQYIRTCTGNIEIFSYPEASIDGGLGSIRFS